MAVVTVTNLTKAYGRRPPALVDVSLEFGEGVTGLLGPNGAGKSTLLQCVLGLLRDFSGRATVLGLDARRQRLEIRRRVGYMPEADALLPRLSGVASCRFLAQLSGLSRREALRRAHECLHYVGLTEHLYKSAEEYSTGMRQRLKLAQAIVHDPDVLFLDEPVSGMDPQGREDFLALVRGLAKEHGKHVVWSSHMLPDVQRVADGILVLQGGHVRGSFRLEDLQGATGRFDLEAEGDPAPFLVALDRHGVEVLEDGEARGGAADPASFRFQRVVRPPKGSPQAIFAAAHAAGTTLRSVTPVVERLEEVFHRLLDGGKAPARPDAPAPPPPAGPEGAR
ncbi:MAG: ABC transporter ATP-binding protein [Planctomycetota bacterium]